MKTTTKWVEQLAFDVQSGDHTVRLDTTEAGGSLDSGMSPKRILLGALSACSGMDVVSILKKMRVNFTMMEIDAEGEQTETDPKVFQFIKIIYRTDVAKEDREKLEKAIRLSQDTYCGISAMLKKACNITWEIVLV